MSRPVMIDLYCCEGGASVGYHRAGFRVIGVDKDPQPRYPFEFHQGDALALLPRLIEQYRPAAVGGSPPCQRYTDLQHRTGKDYPDLLGPTREAFEATGLPYVIENVEGAPLRDPVWLCGSEFGLGADGRLLRRHRGFESNVWLWGAGGCTCSGQPVGGVYGTGGTGQMTRGYKFHPDAAKRAMGIDWMSRAGLSQAIPPVFTQFIGEQLLAHLGAEQVAA